MMNYCLYIFDLDGTVVNSVDAILYSLKGTLTHFGKPIPSDETLKKVIGIPLLEVIRKIGIEDAEAGVEVYREHYYRCLEPMQRLYPGMDEALKALHGKIPMAVATNKGRNGTEKTLAALHIQNRFDTLATEHDVEYPKPSPDELELILDYYGKKRGLKFERSDILMIGDSPVDEAFARNTGIDFAFASWGFYSESDLAAPPNHILKTPADLLAVSGLFEPQPLEIGPELDLHTFQPADSRAVVREYLALAREKGLRTVRIVTGKGHGVMRKSILSLLEDVPGLRVEDAPSYLGGEGALIVTFL